MSVFNRNNVTGFLNQSPGDESMKVEVHPNAHTSLLNVYSEDRLTNSTYASATYTIGGEILQSKINKIALTSYDLRYCISNINKRNDEITFFSSNSGLEHTVIIGTEHYTNTLLIAEIITQLNTVTGASGLTFSGVEIVDCVFELLTIGGEFRFVSSSHIDRAGPCSGLLITTNTVSEMLITVGGQYTNYIDVVIDTFRDAQILQNAFTKDNKYPTNGHMYRIVVDQTDENAYININKQIENLSYVSVRNKEINTLFISLYDQFGELIYSPTQILGSQSFNLPLIKYDMKFSISA